MSYLTFKANSSSTPSTFTPNWAGIGAGGMQYRAVGATEWTDAAKNVAIPVDTVGIELKADTIKTSYDFNFSMTGSISASGDITSLTNGTGGDCTLNGYCYSNMFFNCTSLTVAPALPAMTLADGCYEYMFYLCTSLTAAPELPATTLADHCYEYMFRSCTSLISPPSILPAATAAGYCYARMFQSCSSLTAAPALSATTLSQYCYDGIFYECTSLTAAPELPATTLGPACYAHMFHGCTSLTAAPALPATTLVPGCYHSMFFDCTSLTSPPELPATTLAYGCYYNMFFNCTSLIGYITAEPGYTLIHNHPTTLEDNWNTDMYWNLNAASTVPTTPSSNINYYFKPASPPAPTPSITGKRLECFGHDQHEIAP